VYDKITDFLESDSGAGLYNALDKYCHWNNICESINNLKKSKIDESSSNNTYIVISYYAAEYLDNFYIHCVTHSKKEALEEFKNQSEYQMEDWRKNYYNPSVVVVSLYNIDPAKYDMTFDEFRSAAEYKYGGSDLHWEHRDVVHALADIVRNETAIDETSISDVYPEDDDIDESLNEATIKYSPSVLKRVAKDILSQGGTEDEAKSLVAALSKSFSEYNSREKVYTLKEVS
jgi:hypothetical protein